MGNPEDGGEMVREGWSVELLPSPTRDPEGCRRPENREFVKGSFVCDPDGLLTLQGVERYVKPYDSRGIILYPDLRSQWITNYYYYYCVYNEQMNDICNVMG